MEVITEERVALLKKLVDGAKNVAVAAHTHPDGDALGATAAVALTLKSLGKNPSCILPDSPSENLLFVRADGIPYFFHDKDPEGSVKAAREADLVILLDCNGFSRTEGLEGALAGSKAPKILIDHHLNPEEESFSLVFSTPEVSSASELLYWILKAAFTVSKEAGYFLMAGMTTDTNNFANSVFPSTFSMASELVAAGVDRDAIVEKLNCCYRENRVRLMGYMMYEGLKVLPSGGAYMIVTKEIKERFDLREGESEGLVNVPLAIGKVRLSVLAKEEGDVFRISVRSKKGTSAQRLAQEFFHGGGHENAAGGKLFHGKDVPGREDVEEYIGRVINDFLG